MERALRWLLPGLRLKRWGALVAAGALLMSLGGWYFLGSFGRLPAHRLPWLGVVIATGGLIFGIAGMRGMIRTLLEVFSPLSGGNVAESYARAHALIRGPRVVVIGGGTGLPVLLRGLKEFTANLTAIVTVADDGGSSGRLRWEMDVPPPGDIRNCLLALADTEPLLDQLFQYRFDTGTGLSGHAFGNLFIAAMTRITGDFEVAVRESSRVLAVRGRVLPASPQALMLGARLSDGGEVIGESRIASVASRISHVFLEPADAPANADAVAALGEADIIVLAPGSLYTSVLPNLLVAGIADAVRRSGALRVYVQNIMTQPGETEGYTAADHVQAIRDHVGDGLLDYALVSNSPVPPSLRSRYQEQGASVVEPAAERLRSLGVGIVEADLLEEGVYVRHHSTNTARAILALWLRERRPRETRRLIETYYLQERLKASSR